MGNSAIPSRRARGIAIIGLAIMLITVACGGGGSDPAEEFDPLTSALQDIRVESPDFDHLRDIPTEFTCDGEDRSPRLSWSTPPSGTAALVVVVDDPDAPGGIFGHWAVFNLPSDTRRLDGAIPNGESVPGGGLQAKNDFGALGYGGPCPPRGPAHEYRFFVFAINEPLSLAAGAADDDVIVAMRGHVIGVGQISGMYARR